MRIYRSASVRRRWSRTLVSLGALVLVAFAANGTPGTRKFYRDDPLAQEPETQDASSAKPWGIGLIFDLGYNLFVTGSKKLDNVKAQNVNTIDEVPDSSWFTNRIGHRQISVEEAVRGPNVGPPPVSDQWTIIREKDVGFAPGFTARDSKGDTWFLSFDPPSNPEAATGALIVSTKLFWALGYNQVETFLTSINRENLTISPSATMRRPSGARTPLTMRDLDETFERAARNPDGTYRAAAGRLLPGRVLGGFRYLDVRPDDPNDIVPHQHRRELRALRVFGAWTNLTDMKAGNTLDTLVTENGRGIIKHYLQDVGSTFGIGANGPHDWDEGWEYVYEGDATLQRLATFGFKLSPWQTADYVQHRSIGRFEGDRFDPIGWKPRVPTAAFVQMRDDDGFWAARRVMAFDDQMIRAIVKTGGYSDPAAEKYLADILIKRRDKIGRAYLGRLIPIADPRLGPDGVLTFGNATAGPGSTPTAGRYRTAWFQFNNETGQTAAALGETQGERDRIAAPGRLPSRPGEFLKVELRFETGTQPALQPTHLYFVRQSNGWKLVGLERIPDQPAVTR